MFSLRHNPSTAKLGHGFLDEYLLPFEVIRHAARSLIGPSSWRRAVQRDWEKGKAMESDLFTMTVAAVMLGLGLLTVMTRKNAVGILLGVELLLNAAALTSSPSSTRRGISVDLRRSSSSCCQRSGDSAIALTAHRNYAASWLTD